MCKSYGERFSIAAATLVDTLVEMGVAAPFDWKGGPGSGNFGHEGRPGERGGSAPSSGGAVRESQLKFIPSTDVLRGVRRMVDISLRDTALTMNMTPAAAEKKALANLQEAVDMYPISIRATAESAALILDDGRVKTQFETGTSAGWLDNDYRAEAEMALGYPTDVDPTERPVYGYVATPTYLYDVRNYGEVEFVLNDDVKERATVTVGDSLNMLREEEATGTPMVAVGKEGLDSRPHTDAAVTGDWNSIVYLETQIQGGVRVEDVKAIVYHGVRPSENWGREPFMALEAAAARRGLSVEYRSEEDEDRIITAAALAADARRDAAVEARTKPLSWYLGKAQQKAAPNLLVVATVGGNILIAVPAGTPDPPHATKAYAISVGRGSVTGPMPMQALLKWYDLRFFRTVDPPRPLESYGLKGGPGSGNFGHGGRPGEQGGSAPSGGGSASSPRMGRYKQAVDSGVQNSTFFGRGIFSAHQVTFNDGTKACWKPNNDYYTEYMGMGTAEVEVFAGEVNAVLGLDLVPPTILQELENADPHHLSSADSSRPGSMQEWVAGETEDALATNMVFTPAIKQQIVQLQVFDFVMAQKDRHLANIVVDLAQEKIWAIDNGMSGFEGGSSETAIIESDLSQLIPALLPEVRTRILAADPGELDGPPGFLRTLVQDRIAIVQKAIRKLDAKGGPALGFVQGDKSSGIRSN